jgi:hypothetical protein
MSGAIDLKLATLNNWPKMPSKLYWPWRPSKLCTDHLAREALRNEFTTWPGRPSKSHIYRLATEALQIILTMEPLKIVYWPFGQGGPPSCIHQRGPQNCVLTIWPQRHPKCIDHLAKEILNGKFHQKILNSLNPNTRGPI